MGSSYRPQSPDLSSYAPQSPDLSGYQPQSPDLSGVLPVPHYDQHYSYNRDQFGGSIGYNSYSYGTAPTSVPAQQPYDYPHQYNMPPSTTLKRENEDDGEYLPDASTRRSRRNHQSLPGIDPNGHHSDHQQTQLTAPLQDMSTQPPDATLGVELKTSFPVARIKRIMQADEDIGKVAQVTPHIVSRALELFMIKLISTSAEQARGVPQSATGGSSKGPKRILAQHMKKAIKADETFDFLADIVNKVPDAPTKGKKEAASDSEEGAPAAKAGRKRGKKRKDSGDDI